ncbi:MAG: hypothetical protein ABEI13_03925, partial [Candidatus Paceibacteria bacterium]
MSPYLRYNWYARLHFSTLTIMEFTHQEHKVLTRIQNLISTSIHQTPLAPEDLGNRMFRILKNNRITSEGRYKIISELLRLTYLSEDTLVQLANQISKQTIPEVRTNEFLFFEKKLKNFPKSLDQWKRQSITLNNAKESIRIANQINKFP